MHRWVENIKSAITHLGRRKPDVELSSDASGSGWEGARMVKPNIEVDGNLQSPSPVGPI